MLTMTILILMMVMMVMIVMMVMMVMMVVMVMMMVLGRKGFCPKVYLKLSHLLSFESLF